MAGIYTATPMLDVFEMLGRNELGEGFSEFQHQVKGNLETLRLISDNSDLCYPNVAMRNAFNMKVSPDQDVFVDVNQTVAPGTGTQSRRIGSGGNARVQVQISAQTPIEEGFDISRVNESLSRFSSYSIETRVRFTMAYLTAQAMQNIMVRAELLAQAWIDTNKWAGGGVGSVFAAAGDFKSIPAGVDPELFWKINTEARENKIKTNASGFAILGSDYLEYLMGITSGYGQNNDRNLLASIDNITPYMASELEPPTPATQQAIMYTIARGGVGMIAHAHKFTEGQYSNGQDTWFTAAIPSMPMFDGINTDLIEIQGKGFQGWVDNFATYANDQSRIDIVQAMSFVATFYFFRAYSPTARRPIVGYVKLK